MNTSGEVSAAMLMEGPSSEGELSELSATERAYLKYSGKHGVNPEDMDAYLEHIHASHAQRRHVGQIHG